jgi:chromatin remodeling complex protein RSC6
MPPKKTASTTSTTSTKTASKTTASKSKKVTAAPKVAEPAAAADAATDAPVEAEAVQNELGTQFAEFSGRLTSLRTQISSLLTDFRALQKRAERELKASQKASQKRKRKTGNRQPSGFVKPTLISDQLANFLGKAKGSELARTEVTREINAYIRANKLQDPTNGRKINPDSKLKTLLNLTPADELTYFNLQKYMSPHFAKAGAAPLASLATSS